MKPAWTSRLHRCALAMVIAIAAANGCERAPDAESASGANQTQSARGSDSGFAHESENASKTAAPTIEDRSLAEVLANVVTDDGLVDYNELASEANRALLDQAIAHIAQTNLAESASKDQKLALWINAFNANVLKMAAAARAEPGFTNVNDVPGFFDERTIIVAEEQITLSQLRDRVRELGDPRIHAALVCAAKGSPPLRAEPFTATRIDQQLDQQALRWLDDMADNRAARDGLWLSPVFQQFESDFDVPPYDGILGFARKHSRPNGAIRDFVRSVSSIRVRHAEFDWTLNQAP